MRGISARSSAMGGVTITPVRARGSRDHLFVRPRQMRPASRSTSSDRSRVSSPGRHPVRSKTRKSATAMAKTANVFSASRSATSTRRFGCVGVCAPGVERFDVAPGHIAKPLRPDVVTCLVRRVDMLGQQPCGTRRRCGPIGRSFRAVRATASLDDEPTPPCRRFANVVARLSHVPAFVTAHVVPPRGSAGSSPRATCTLCT